MAGDSSASEPLLPESQDCETGVWGFTPGQRRSAPSSGGPVLENANSGGDNTSVAASVVTLLFSLPALVGSWCWPLLLAGFMGIAATAAAKDLAHTISFGVTLALITNMAQYTLHKCFTRRGRHWNRFGPFYLCALGVPFIMADLTRHVLQDSGFWPSPGSDMYIPDCDSRGIGGLLCLSAVGWFFTIFCTYTGFGLLIWGMLWATDIHKKVAAAWTALRSR